MNQWEGGATIDITISNNTSDIVNDWRLKISGVEVDTFWNVNHTQGILTPIDWNKNISARGSISFGMKISGDPSSIRLAIV